MKQVIVIIFFISSVIIPQNKTLTIEESVQIGLRNSKDLSISKSKTRLADAKITEISSQMLPQLKFSASYSRLSEVPPFEVVTPFSPSPIRLQDAILNNYNFRLSLQQPLFTGFRLSALQSAAEYTYQASQYEYSAAENDHVIRIQEAFWNFYNSQKVAELLSEQLVSINQHLTDTKNFMENGLATLNDVLKLEVQYSNLELKLIEAENNLELARINFNRMIGLELFSETEILVQEFIPQYEKFLVQELIEEALQNRNEIKSFENRLIASEESITASNSGWYPSIYLFGNAYYNKPNQRIMPAKDQFDDSWDVGISLNWDLWNWGHTSSQSDQAEELKLQTETNLLQLTESIETEVTREYLNYTKSIKKVEVARKSVEQATENYRLTNEKYNSQVASSSDLIDAQTYQLEAETNLVSAIVSFHISKAKLERAAGRKLY